ncbi:MAG: hypothetical protein GWP08_13935 [Nitrospiraceae bacterium]|nr:hypothetical protein [Nitrospiraceae bacterium]
MAIILSTTWGNLRVGSRPMRVDNNFAYAQGVCHDLESNLQMSAEVARGITYKNGQRYNDDLIATTMAAACSIAMRNAVLKTVPNWREVYTSVMTYLQGDAASLPETRARCVAAFREFGVTGEMLAKKMERERVDDLTAADVFDLRGFYTAIKDGDAKVETIFPTKEETKTATNASALKDKLDKAKAKQQTKPEPEAKPEADAPPAKEATQPTPSDTKESNHVTLDTEPLETLTEPTRITLKHIESRLRGIYAARKSLRDVLTKFIFNQQPPKDATPEQLSRADDILTAFVKSGEKPGEIPDLLDRLKGLKV